MDGKTEEELEVAEWELINNDESPIVEFNSNSSSIIRSDHFSLNPIHQNPNSVPRSSSSSSETDRNFDDSYVVNQIFTNPIALSSSSSNSNRWNDSDSENSDISENSDRGVTVSASLTGDVEVGFDSEEKVEDGEVEEKEVKGDDERLVWWKVPFEVLKHWVSPVLIPLPLSVAAAAAFLGLLILGRRLYKMKRKTQTLKLNLALDDKRMNCE